MIRFQWTGNLYEFLCPWHRSSSTYFREASKSLDINLKENDDNSHIARRQTSLRDGHRQLDDKLLYGKTVDGKKHSDRLATTSRFQNKSGKICVNNNIKDQSFRSNSIFDSNDIFTYPRDIRKNISFVIGNVQDNSKLIGRLESRLSGENNWHVNRSC